MGNTNFQTIHQMGTAISNMVKQATGRDAVQNIDMEHVTVAQNHRYEEVDVSGRVVSFQAGEAGLPFEKMIVQIKPVQDLHGYDHPWPAGGGKNKWDGSLPYDVEETYWSWNTGATTNCCLKLFDKGNNADISGVYFGLTVTGGNIPVVWAVQNGEIMQDGFIKTGTAYRTPLYPYVSIYPRTAEALTKIANRFNVMVSVDDDEATTYSPYSNICPITGWTMVNVYQSGQNMEDARVYRFPFPSEAGIVYGGTLNVVTGELTVDRAMVDLGALDWLYNVSGLSVFSTYSLRDVIKSRDAACNIYTVEQTASTSGAITNAADMTVLINIGSNITGSLPQGTVIVKNSKFTDATAFKTAMSGTQFVYELTTPVFYTLTAAQVATLLGQNNIWADTGDIEVKFTNVKELY